MKRLISLLTLFLAPNLLLAAPVTYSPTLLPLSDNAYDLGTTTNRWRNIYLAGTVSAPLSLTLAGFTQGSALYVGSGGSISQDNANFLWDATNHRLGLGSTTPSQLLSVQGNGLFSGNISAASITATGTALFADGSAGAPSIAFSAQPTTGFFRSGSGQIALGTNNQLLFNNGTVGAPSFAFTNDATSGIYRAANPTQIGIVVGGAEKVRIDNSGNVGIGTTTPYAKLSIQSGASTGDAFAVATSSGAAVFGVDNDGHRWSSGPTPTLSSCGTGSPTITGDDQTGTITTGTAATSCTLTFAKVYRNTPVCNFNDDSSTIPGDISSISTSAVTFALGAGLSGGYLYYSCKYHH